MLEMQKKYSKLIICLNQKLKKFKIKLKGKLIDKLKKQIKKWKIYKEKKNNQVQLQKSQNQTNIIQ